jgi:hypothetical protein
VLNNLTLHTEFINLLNRDGTFNANAGEYEGMKRFDARLAVIGKLKVGGFAIFFILCSFYYSLFLRQKQKLSIIPLAVFLPLVFHDSARSLFPHYLFTTLDIINPPHL